MLLEQLIHEFAHRGFGWIDFEFLANPLMSADLQNFSRVGPMAVCALAMCELLKSAAYLTEMEVVSNPERCCFE